MIDRARELTEADGLQNVTFVHADAQIHCFPSESFDVAISRFGMMFFVIPWRLLQHRPGAAARWTADDDGLAGSRAEQVESAIAHALAGGREFLPPLRRDPIRFHWPIHTPCSAS
jgi:hypothetical protein